MKKELQSNWYQELLLDLKKLEFTGIVLTKWNIGKRILDDFDKFGKPEYGSKRIENIAKDLGGSSSDLYACIQFAKKYPKIPTAWENSSWRDVRNNYLPEQKQHDRKLLSNPELPKGKYQVIYADPAWQYNNSGISGAADNHYPTMATEDICKMPIKELTTDNAVLFLWVTNPFLVEGLQVTNAWGFEYKTNMVWIKDKAGQGFYVKGQHELLFICTKGSFTPDNSLYVKSVFEAPRQKHSEKPKEFYGFIEKLYPNCKYLELFARNKRNNWTSYGNEL